MKTIEERAILNLQYEKDFLGRNLSDNMVCRAYVQGATEQKAIYKANYKQGYNDAIKKACNVFCYTGCPHKIDSYNCLNDKCDTWEMFRRMMEE